MGQEQAIALYQLKNEWLSENNQLVTPFDFYRDIFPIGSFERKGHQEDCKPNGIVIEFLESGKVQRQTVTDDLDALCQDRKGFTIFSPISYFGYQRSGINARLIYAMTFDLDGVGMPQLKDLLHQMKNNIIPTATYICNSGNGMHLYYVFKEPIPMYPQNQKYLKAVKYALTKRVWNGYTSTIDKQQMQGVLQGFRVVGSPTKFGSLYPVIAFKHGGRFTIDELVGYIPDIDFSGLKEIKALEKKSKISLEQAKKKYPEWYKRRIVNGQKKGRWNIKRDLYDWWLARIRKEIDVGHRYYAIMTLAIYAKKCNISEEELYKDAFSLLKPYDAKTNDKNNHFEEQHIIDALELYNEDYVTFPKSDIEKLSGLQIIPKIRRNGRNRKEHLERARAVQSIDYPNGSWRNKKGRPKGKSKQREKIEVYKKENPKSKPKDCMTDTGVSKNTVYKYWHM